MRLTTSLRRGAALLISGAFIGLGSIAFASLSNAATPAAVNPAVQTAAKPKLLVVMVVDGLPNEQIARYAHQFGKGGLRRLIEQGAWFSNAHQAHGVTVTAVGHAAVLTGAYPYQHGVIGNNWIDPTTMKSTYCTSDTAYTYINEATNPEDGTSPAKLRVDTLGDQLRYATGNLAKVIAVSGKDRGAILMAGKSGTAYMYMDDSGNFASSTYYMKEHPEWVQRYSASKPQDRFYGQSWKPLLDKSAYLTDAPDDLVPQKSGVRDRFPFNYYSESGKIDKEYYNRLRVGPFLDQLTLDFAEAAIEGEKLGLNPAGVPDLLAVSLSSHDYVNHAFGPESRMSHDHLLRLDRMMESFFNRLDKRLGKDNFMVVLTADHGFPNVPEFTSANKMDSNRLDPRKLSAALDTHMQEKYGLAKLVAAASLPNIHLDYAQIDKANLKRDDVETAAARFLLKQAGVAQVYTRTQLENNLVGATRIGVLMQRAWNRHLSGDLMVVTKPYWYFGSGTTGTSHGSPYVYDTNVPLLIMGSKWIKPGHYPHYAETVDIAPTLSYLLNLRPPSGSEGRILSETLR